MKPEQHSELLRKVWSRLNIPLREMALKSAGINLSRPTDPLDTIQRSVTPRQYAKLIAILYFYMLEHNLYTIEEKEE